MFYNYLKLIYSFIKENNLDKIKKINKINNLFISSINNKKMHGGSDLVDLKNVDDNISNINQKFKFIFTDILEILKKKAENKNFSNDQLKFIKDTLLLLKNLINEIENIKEEDIQKLKSDLEEINKILIDLSEKIIEP
jgi:hypothetical protein